MSTQERSGQDSGEEKPKVPWSERLRRYLGKQVAQLPMPAHHIPELTKQPDAHTIKGEVKNSEMPQTFPMIGPEGAYEVEVHSTGKQSRPVDLQDLLPKKTGEIVVVTRPLPEHGHMETNTLLTLEPSSSFDGEEVTQFVCYSASAIKSPESNTYRYPLREQPLLQAFWIRDDQYDERDLISLMPGSTVSFLRPIPHEVLPESYEASKLSYQAEKLRNLLVQLKAAQNTRGTRT